VFFAGSSLCDGLITRSGEYYLVCVFFWGSLVLIWDVEPQKECRKATVPALGFGCEKVHPVRLITNETNY